MSQSTAAGARDILSIWKDVDESPGRPVKIRNAHANLKWWLEQHFPSLHFEYLMMSDEGCARDKIVEFINGGMPVLMSVSHARVQGHIVMVIGYENYVPLVSSSDFKVVVHDPYGKFDPSILSNTYGRRNVAVEGRRKWSRPELYLSNNGGKPRHLLPAVCPMIGSCLMTKFQAPRTLADSWTDLKQPLRDRLRLLELAAASTRVGGYRRLNILLPDGRVLHSQAGPSLCCDTSLAVR